jgi:hypothetical protein
MIFLEIPFFRHYVFAVVQKSSSPTHPGGNPPSIWYARARRKEGAGCRVRGAGCGVRGAGGGHYGRNGQKTGTRCTAHLTTVLSITTGTVAPLFKPRAISSVKAATLQIFRVFRAFRGQKNRLWASAHAKPFCVFSWLKNPFGTRARSV